MAKIVKKLTMKEMGAKPDILKIVEAHKLGQRLPIARVLGIARKTKPYISPQDGKESIQFFGSFKGVNLATGEEVHSGKAFFPGAIPELLYGALGNETQEVQFAFDIFARFDSTAVTKYVYEVESLIALAENDPISLLSDGITVALPALPAPASAPETPAPKTPAPETPAPETPPAATGKGKGKGKGEK